MKKLLIIMLIFFITPVYAGALYDGTGSRPIYFSFGFGYAYNNYDDSLTNTLNEIDRIGGYLNVGIYLPVAEQILVGGVFNISFDKLVDSNDAYNYLYVNNGLISGSVLYYPSKIEDGFYFRGDIGLSYAKVNFSDNRDLRKDSLDLGAGFLVGLGYSIPLMSRSLSFDLFVSHRQIFNSENESSSTTFGGGISVMF